MFVAIKKRIWLSRLRGPNPKASYAADALVGLGDRSIIPDLLERLKSKDLNSEVWLVLEILGRLGDSTTPRAILQRLQPIARIYQPLAEAFKRLRAAESEWFELLCSVAKDTSYFRTDHSYAENYRIEAITRLSLMGTRSLEIIQALAGDRVLGTGDGSERVRREARELLKRLPQYSNRRGRGEYTDAEIEFVIKSLTAWSVLRRNNEYSPNLYDESEVFRPRLAASEVRSHLNLGSLEKAIEAVTTAQWVKKMASHPEFDVARTFVYTPYLQGEAAELVHERESLA